MLTREGLDKMSEELISRLVTVMEQQRMQIAQYEGAIEGIRLFLRELKGKLDGAPGTPELQSNGAKEAPPSESK